MGRPVDPTRRRRGTGNRPQAGDARLSLVAPLPAAAPPPVPDELTSLEDPYAAAVWETAVAELHHRGLKPADLEAVRMLCIQAHRARQASAYIERYGLLVENNRGGLTENPMIRVERDATREYVRLAQDFGLTFAARLRLGLLQLTGESILRSLNEDLDQAALPAPAARPARAPAKRSAKKKPAAKRTTKK